MVSMIVIVVNIDQSRCVSGTGSTKMMRLHAAQAPAPQHCQKHTITMIKIYSQITTEVSKRMFKTFYTVTTFILSFVKMSCLFKNLKFCKYAYVIAMGMNIRVDSGHSLDPWDLLSPSSFYDLGKIYE
jgi:hypothetical protein